MSAAEDLRRMLDERGVWHTDAAHGHTEYTWWSDGDHEIAACNSGKRLAVYNLTPEQAIEATLGRGTCRIRDEKCDQCGAIIHDHANLHWVPVGEGMWTVEHRNVHYCPNCGARIVDGTRTEPPT